MDHDGWDEFEKVERRKTEDERVVQEWLQANAGGCGLERHVRNFVRHVRQDIGVDGVITKVVEVKSNGQGVEIVLAYRHGPDLAGRTVGCAPSAGIPSMDRSVASHAAVVNQLAAAEGGSPTPATRVGESVGEMFASESTQGGDPNDASRTYG